MKRILFILIAFLCLSGQVWADPTECREPIQLARMNGYIAGAQSAAAATAFCTKGTACPGNDCSLLCEDWEGAVDCVTGSLPYCRNTWATSGTFTTQTWNYSTSPAPLQGSLSYYGDSGGTGTRITKAITESTTVYGFSAFVSGTMSTGLYSTDSAVKLLNSTTAVAIFGYTQSAAGVYKWSASCGGAAATSAGFTFTTGAVYYLNFYYKVGTGANAECQLDVYSDKGMTTQVATTGLKNSGSATANVDTVELFATNTTFDQTIHDALKLHTSTIGGQSW